MARKLSIKHKKHRRDHDRAYKAGAVANPHKVAVERSAKAKLKKAYKMA